MFLRRLTTSASTALRRGANDGGVLAAVRAEIAHELSSSTPSSSPPSLHPQDIADFATVSDAPRGQEVILRRRRRAASSGEGEEVLVSALLAPLQLEDGELPPVCRDALMKVFVSKPGVKPVLRFDCRAFTVTDRDGGVAGDYQVTAVSYHPSPGDDGEEDKYGGPEFSGLDPQLQVALKEYLVAKGVDSKLAKSLLHYLIQKEEVQYVDWLRTLEKMFSKDN